MTDSWLRRAVVEKGLLAESEVAIIDQWPAVRGRRLVEKLYRSAALDGDTLRDLFVANGATDRTSELVDKLPPPSALGALERLLAERHRAIALKVERGRVLVGMLDPSDTTALEKITFFTGLAVEPAVISAPVLFEALSRAYGISPLIPDTAFLRTWLPARAVAVLGADAVGPAAPGADESKTQSATLGTPRAPRRAIDEQPVPATEPHGLDMLLKTSVIVKPDATQNETTGIEPTPTETAIAPHAPQAPPTEPSPMRPVSLHVADNEDTDSHYAAMMDVEPQSAEGSREPLDFSSPLARGLVGLTSEGEPLAHADDSERRTALSLARVSDLRPATTPIVDVRRNLPQTQQPRAARDSLPPQVLHLLVPPFRAAALFLVRDNVAVGWDGLGDEISRPDIHDILLPLSGKSAFQRAWEWGFVAAGNPQDPTTIERIFFRCLRGPVPVAFAVLPILVGNTPVALLYVDRTAGPLDDQLLASVRQCGTTLADGLAPLIANGTLFAPPVNSAMAASAAMAATSSKAGDVVTSRPPLK